MFTCSTYYGLKIRPPDTDFSKVWHWPSCKITPLLIKYYNKKHYTFKMFLTNVLKLFLNALTQLKKVKYLKKSFIVLK